MRFGQRGKFVGHKNYDGFLKGGELFTVKEIDEYFSEDGIWCFEVRLDTGETEWLLSDQIEMNTTEDDIETLRILIKKYPEQARKLVNYFIK